MPANKVTLLTEWKCNTDSTGAYPNGCSPASIVPEVYESFDKALSRAKLVCASYAKYYNGSVKYPDERNFSKGSAFEFIAANDVGTPVRAVTLHSVEVL